MINIYLSCDESNSVLTLPGMSGIRFLSISDIIYACSSDQIGTVPARFQTTFGGSMPLF